MYINITHRALLQQLLGFVFNTTASPQLMLLVAGFATATKLKPHFFTFLCYSFWCWPPVPF